MKNRIGNGLLSEQFRKANNRDFDGLVQVICRSFQHDPCFRWMIGEKKFNRKIYYLAEYLIAETIAKGDAFISHNGYAAALWQSEKKEPLSMRFIRRNLKFLFKMGVPVVWRSLKLLRLKEASIADPKPYLYLACIGVMPEGQGNGMASGLLNPILMAAAQAGKHVYLETANPQNVRIYQKKGFEITQEVNLSDVKIVFMVKRCATVQTDKG